MKIFSGYSLRYFVLLWLGLVCGMTSLNAGAQESGATNSSASSLSGNASSSMDATVESADLDSEQRDRRNRTWDDQHWNHRWHRHEHRRELVSIGHDSSLAAGERADTVVSVLGSSTSDGEVSDAVVSVLGNTRVTGPVGGDVVAVLGNVYVNSKVGHDVVAVGGDVQLGAQAEVDGEVTTVGGKVTRDPAAMVRGGTKDLSFGGKVGFDWLHPWIDHCLRYARPLALAPGLGWAWTIAMLSLLSYVLTAWLMPRAVDRCVTTLETHPGHSLLAALLASLATPILFILLVITVIGILAIPFVGIALLCVGFFGKLVMLAWLGRRIAPSFKSDSPAHAALVTLIGGILVTVLYCVPVLGFVTYKLLGFVGFGVVVYALLLNIKGKRQQGGPNGSASAARQAYEAQPQASADGETTDSVDASQGAGETQQPLAMNAGMPRASFVMRMGALLVDVILVAFVLNLIYDSHHILLLALAVYGALMWKFRGTTIGGILFNLRVVRLDGRELDWPTVVVRALSCFLSLIVAGLGFIWIAFDDDKQAWHDKIAGTVVVRTPKGAPLI